MVASFPSPVKLVTDIDILDFYLINVHITEEDIERIYSKTTDQNMFWHKERQLRITGTTAHHQFNTNKIAVDWSLKCSRILLPTNPFHGNAATRYGKMNEPVALQTLEKAGYSITTNWDFASISISPN